MPFCAPRSMFVHVHRSRLRILLVSLVLTTGVHTAEIRAAGVRAGGVRASGIRARLPSRKRISRLARAIRPLLVSTTGAVLGWVSAQARWLPEHWPAVHSIGSRFRAMLDGDPTVETMLFGAASAVVADAFVRSCAKLVSRTRHTPSTGEPRGSEKFRWHEKWSWIGHAAMATVWLGACSLVERTTWRDHTLDQLECARVESHFRTEVNDKKVSNTQKRLDALAESAANLYAVHQTPSRLDPSPILSAMQNVNGALLRQRPAEVESLVVGTFNVGLLSNLGVHVPYAQRRAAAIADRIIQRDPDIVFLQELLDEYALVGLKTEELMKRYALVTGSPVNFFKHGLGILIKRDLLAESATEVEVVERVWDSQPTHARIVGFGKGVLGAKIEIKALIDEPLYLLSFHFTAMPWTAANRTAQIEEFVTGLLQPLRANQRGVLIVGGDANISPSYSADRPGWWDNARLYPLIVRGIAGLDSFAAVHGDIEVARPNIGVGEPGYWPTQSRDAYMTRELSVTTRDEPSQRVDYVFARPLSPNVELGFSHAGSACFEAVVDVGRGQFVELSDHFYYETRMWLWKGRF